MNVRTALALAFAFGPAAVLRAQDGAQAPTKSDADILKAVRDSLPFDVHGGLWLWYYEPFLDGAKSNTEVYYANLVLDGKYEGWGFHFEPRFRDTPLRPFFTSNTWIQEAYLSWDPADEGGGTLKAGKVYSQFGRFWDGVFYGNIPYFDGLKLDPDMGLSWEAKHKLGEKSSLDWSVQYFTQDGSTNGSLQGRDTLSVGTQRDTAVARVAPTIGFGEKSSATVGVSAMHFDADFASGTNDSSVSRLNGEASFTVGPFTAFGDFTHQNGNHVVDFPVAGSNSDDIDYLMSGLSCQLDKFTLRYTFSSGDYKDEDIREDLHMPAVVYAINPHISVWLEYVYWTRDDAGSPEVIDRSLNLMLYGSF